MPLSSERQRVQHLLRRAGFGYGPAELERYVALGLDGTIDRLVHPERVDDARVDALLAEALRGDPREHRPSLVANWHLRLVHSDRPLLEKLTFFWHGHFATGIHKVGSPAMMLMQNETLRAGALGGFRELLLSVTRDPAMLWWLDNRANTAGAPNENYARELMELFTLGAGGGYTEVDVREAARALTGWRVTGRDGTDPRAVFARRRHDDGIKRFLGVEGHLDDADVVDILSAQPETAAFIGVKLWRFLAVPEPTADMVARTTRAYFDHDGSIREMVAVILHSDEMYSPAAYRWRIKSPVELIVGAERALGAATAGYGESALSAAMGQLLFDPPNPAGWPGGMSWINSTSMLARSNFAALLTRSRAGRAITVDLGATFATLGATESAATLVDTLADLLVGGDLDPAVRDLLIDHVGGPFHYRFEDAAASGALHGLVYLALSMPLYQLA